MAKKPVIALMYDFDKTLITTDMQNFGFIPSLGLTKDEFWKEVNEFTKEKQMDALLSYMFIMLKVLSIARENCSTRNRFHNFSLLIKQTFILILSDARKDTRC